MMQSTARSLRNAPSFSAAPRGGNGLQVLARVPDVAVPAIELWQEPAESPWYTRLLTPALRTNLLLGAGVLLISAAILPFLMGRDKKTPSILPPPDPFSAAAPSETSKTAAVPAGAVPAAAVPAVADKQGSSVAELAGANPRKVEPVAKVPGLSVSQPPGDVAPAPSPWPNPATVGQVPSAEQSPPVDPTRVLPSPRNPTDWNAPIDRYPQTGAVNRPMSLGDPPPAPGRGYPAESLADRQMSPPPSGPASPFEPGAARLEGTIEKPSVRTTYDRPRPGIY